MTRSDQRHTLIVQIEVGSELTRFIPPEGAEASNLDHFLKALLSDLLLDFDLALNTLIRIQPASNSVSVAAKEIRVTIDGRSIRFGPDFAIAEELTGDALASWITSVVIADPDFLVNDYIAHEIALDWAATGVPWFLKNMSPEQFAHLLHQLMARGFRVTRARDWARECAPNPNFVFDPSDVFEAVTEPLGTCSLTVNLTDGLFDFIQTQGEPKELNPGAEDKSVSGRFQLMRDGLYYEVGVPLPKVTIAREMFLKGSLYRLRLNDRRLTPGVVIEEGLMMVNAPKEKLKALGIASSETTNPANGVPTLLIEDNKAVAEQLERDGYWAWDRAGYLVLSLAGVIRRRIGDLYMRGVASMQLDMLAMAFPGLVKAARLNLGDDKITRVFRALADDEVSIRDHRSLLEALLLNTDSMEVVPKNLEAEADATGACGLSSSKGVSELEIHESVSRCRRVLKRYISHKYAPQGVLNAYKLDDESEQRLRRVNGQPLNEADFYTLIRAVTKVLDEYPLSDLRPVLLLPFDLRSTLRNTIRFYYPSFHVLSPEELTADVNIKVLGEISLT